MVAVVVHQSDPPGQLPALGNSWFAAMSSERYRKYKSQNKQDGFGLYPSDRGETPEADLLTEIDVPVWGQETLSTAEW